MDNVSYSLLLSTTNVCLSIHETLLDYELGTSLGITVSALSYVIICYHKAQEEIFFFVGLCFLVLLPMVKAGQIVFFGYCGLIIRNTTSNSNL